MNLKRTGIWRCYLLPIWVRLWPGFQFKGRIWSQTPLKYGQPRILRAFSFYLPMKSSRFKYSGFIMAFPSPHIFEATIRHRELIDISHTLFSNHYFLFHSNYKFPWTYVNYMINYQIGMFWSNSRTQIIVVCSVICWTTRSLRFQRNC